MKQAGKIASGVAALMMMAAGAAFAADVPTVIAPAAPPPPPAPVFGWSGAYIGAYGGAFFGFPAAFGNWRAGGQAGYNFVFGRTVTGLEAQVGAEFVLGPLAGVLDWSISGRVGVLAIDNVLVYAEAGVLGAFISPLTIWIAGGGVELGVGDGFSLFAEAAVHGSWIAGPYGFVAHLGVNWHPGN